MEDDDGIHRLEGISDQKGGLIVKKKQPTFKVPQPSLLGLDKLAEAKRRERKELERKMSFAVDGDDDNNDSLESSKQPRKDERKFRSPQVETPTYTGGITKEARERLIERLNANKNKEKGVYASTKDAKRNKDYSDKNREHYRHESYDRRRKDHYKEKYDRHSSVREKTPRFKDEPRTPNIKLKNEPSRTSWDDEDDSVPCKKSTWDFPTPSTYKSSGDWSERSVKSRKFDNSERSRSSTSRENSRDRQKGRYEDDTPRPTPAHRFNAWAKDRKRSGATPGKEENVKWDATVDRELWEEEQKRIDREWYNMDEGYDNENNPFASVSDDYTKKKEEQLEQRKKKRMSAQQRQINKDNELWERNRMLTSGVVHSVDFNEDFDEESTERVHLLVHNIVPPFLDGRIVFTKQPEPVIPVR